MKVKVKLYGTLSLYVPGYKPSQGIEVEIPDGATVKDLLAHLEISETRGVVVIVEGRTLKMNDELSEDVSVNVLQVLRGG